MSIFVSDSRDFPKSPKIPANATLINITRLIKMKLFHKIHLWLSVPFGLVMTVTCLSGAILVFEKEITGMLNSRQEAVVKIGEGKAGTEISNTYKENSDKDTAVIKKNVKKTYPFFKTTRSIHRWLLDKPTGKKISAGRTIVGISTLMMALVLASGLVIWWPHSGKALRNRLTVSCSNGMRRFLHDTHSSLGFYVCLILFIMAITGLSWSFTWWGYGMKSLISVLAPEANPMKLIWLIHTGAWGGLFSKALWFISALIGATLPLTGYYMWFKRIKKH